MAGGVKEDGEGPRIVVFGASRYVGRHLFARLGHSASVATYYSRQVPGARYFDALRMNASDLLDGHPSVKGAVLLLGETDPNRCIADKARSEALNVRGLIRIIDALVERDCYVVFVSSQFIFDGTKGFYSEQDPPTPILLYGEQKARVEDYLRHQTANHCILRLSKAVGDQPDDGTLFCDWLTQILNGISSIRCPTDQIQSPIYIPDLVEALLRILDRQCCGTYNLCGNGAWSRMRLLQLLIDSLRATRDIDIDLVPCGINDFDLPEKRPLDVSMKPDKLVAATGVYLTPMPEVCRRTVENHLRRACGPKDKR